MINGLMLSSYLNGEKLIQALVHFALQDEVRNHVASLFMDRTLTLRSS